MLKRLRRKFIAITMVLSGAVLVGVLGTTLWTTYTTQRSLVEEALERSLNNDLNQMPMMGGQPPNGSGGRDANMLVIAVDASSDGVVLETSRAPVVINSTVLSTIVDSALDSGSDRDAIPSLHVAWRRAFRDDGSIRIVIVDTSAMDAALSEQVVGDLKITIVALIIMFAIVWWLSGWALEPVARAWEEQRRFVADASHELKTPLAVIMANTDILLRDEAMPAESMRWVQSTGEEAKHMKGLVNDLLELARADESATGGATSALRLEQVDFSELVDSATLEFDALAFERGCTLDAQIAPGITIMGDRDWLSRVVRILIDNACKYAAVGTTVRVTLEKASPHARLVVNNMGNPIGAEDLPHVFERFYRSDKVRTRGTGGFGLGLAIAKSIVEAHNGKIWVTSSEEAGTTFTVVL